LNIGNEKFHLKKQSGPCLLNYYVNNIIY